MNATIPNNDNKIEPIIFTANAMEFFKIWIVNLALSIITLGLYIPWARVRTKRYLYTHTQIKGSSFDFHANPIAILKGMLLAVVFFVLYSFVSSFSPILGFGFMLLLFIMVPWLIIKSLAFKLRNTSYRGLRFNFQASYGEAAVVFIGLAILVPFTLGLIIPYLIYRQKQFIVSHSHYGKSPFTFHATALGFYKIYALVMLVFLIPMFAAIAIPAYQSYKMKAEQAQKIEQSMPQGNTEGSADEIPEGGGNEEADAQDSTADAVPPATQNTAPQNSQTPNNKAEKPVTPPLIAGVVWVGMMALYIFFFAYIQAATANLVWNNIELDKLTFKSSLKTTGIAWLYFTNTLLILLTLGLAIPWAQIRMVRYRVEHLQMLAHGDLSDFVAHQAGMVSAAGEQIGEAFDIDVGLGI